MSIGLAIPFANDDDNDNKTPGPERDWTPSRTSRRQRRIVTMENITVRRAAIQDASSPGRGAGEGYERDREQASLTHFAWCASFWTRTRSWLSGSLPIGINEAAARR